MEDAMERFEKFPFDIVPVPEHTSQQIMRDFQGERTGFVRVGPKKYFFPHKFLHQADNYYNFKVRDDDIWVVSFPRSGTTLTQELVWLIANDLDFKTASAVSLTERFPFFEFGLFFHDQVKSELLQMNAHSEHKQRMVERLARHGWEFLSTSTGPRFIKSHFPFSLLPKDWTRKQCKTIYVARNPKDVAVSFYHLNRLFKTQGYRGNFPQYWQYFKRNLQPWAPYWSHVEEGWSRRSDPNVLFLSYEQLVQDMHGSVQTVARFLNKTLSERAIDALVNYLDIKNFRTNSAVTEQLFKELHVTNVGEQGFIRNGRVNGDDDELTDEIRTEIRQWATNNMNKIHTDFSFMQLEPERFMFK